MRFFAHTATCRRCGVLLCYPYPKSDDELFQSGIGRDNVKDVEQVKNRTLQWHINSGVRNHHNFTNMVLFALNDRDRHREMKVLDYGGGGGQFALVLRSLFPLSEIFIVDFDDGKLIDQFRPLNNQIKFKDFLRNDTIKFDFIFLNDVFEHVSDPIDVLKTLRSRLFSQDSGIFIDTPRKFWLYPITRLFSKKIHTKVLRGTVDYDHQQIWSKRSFYYVVKQANLSVVKYSETSEYTQPPEFYLDNMKIANPIMRMVGKTFARMAPLIARNKIMAVLKPNK